MLIVFLALLFAQQPADEPPLVGRPSEGWYGAIGEQVRIEFFVAPGEVEVEEPVVLTLKISGAINPEKINRPDLRQIPDFAKQFHIDDLPETPSKTDRVFQYRLRPKNEQVRAIPSLVFRYFDPKKKYYASTAPQAELPLAVKPHAVSPGSGGPMQEPEFLFNVVDQSDLFRMPSSENVRFAWLVAALLIPMIVFEFWYLIWRRARPSAAKLAQIRRSRAVRSALDALKALDGVGPPALADRSAEIFRTYVEDRFGFSARAATPDEIVAEFGRLGMPPGRLERTRAFFHLCDAVRFGPPEKPNESLAAAAEQLVLTLENAV